MATVQQLNGASSEDGVLLPQSMNALAELGPLPGPGTRPGTAWQAVEWLPIQLSVALPIPNFRVRDLLALDAGQTIATEWPNGDDLPLSIEEVQLGWVEMETVEQEMAVRITRLL